MTDKKLINSVDTCVDECLYGLTSAHPHLILHSEQRVIYDGNLNPSKKVAVISGGGSGHEPFSAGYVGDGMLTASVSGSVFASPPSNHILDAIRLAASENEGVFLVIPNYTGDVLNFGLSVEIAKNENIKIDSIVIGEDIALESYGIRTRVGKRGMCGLVLIFKIAGYLSAQGESLSNIKKISEIALNSMASIGLCFTACSLPGSGLLFHLKPDEMELGVGVHGEAGAQRTNVKSAKEIAEIFLTHLIKHLEIQPGDEVVTVINNLGALSNLEQWLIAGEIKKQLTERNISVARIYAGPIFTSLNMAGVQVCLLKLSQHKELFLNALDYPTDAPGWPGKSSSVHRKKITGKKSSPAENLILRGNESKADDAVFVEKCLKNVATAIISNEKRLNDLDSGCGDGDCGTTLRHLAQEIIKSIDDNKLIFDRPATLSNQLAILAQKSMGGTSGAIYSLFFTTVGRELENYDDFTDPKVWVNVWKKGIDGLKKYSVARVGDRTMFDSLEPACDKFEDCLKSKGVDGVEALKLAVKAAEEGCQRTKSMRALAGRASYVDQSQLKDVDAGAYAVTVWLSALYASFIQ